MAGILREVSLIGNSPNPGAQPQYRFIQVGNSGSDPVPGRGVAGREGHRHVGRGLLDQLYHATGLDRDNEQTVPSRFIFLRVFKYVKPASLEAIWSPVQIQHMA